MQQALLVLSIASRANAKNQHVLWPIRAPTLRLRQSERHIPAAPIRTSELSSRLSGQGRILRHFGASRLHTHASRNITSKAAILQYNFLSPLLCLWSTCHSLFGINDESLYWRVRQDSLGKSSKMRNDAYGLPRGLLHSMSKGNQASKLQIRKAGTIRPLARMRRNSTSLVPIWETGTPGVNCGIVAW